MKMRNKKKWILNIDEIENFALYIGLGIVIFLDFISQFIPILSSYFVQSSAPFYLSTLLVFRILYKKISEIRTSTGLASSLGKDFNARISELIKAYPRMNTLDFLATNTRKFYHAIEDLEFYADTIRILIYEDTPEVENIVEQWKKLCDKGICKNFELRTYSTQPTFYGMIMNGKNGCFGFFNPNYMSNPKKNLGIMKISGPYLLQHKNPVEKAVLSDIEDWFNNVFEHHSKKIYSLNEKDLSASL